MVCSPLDRDMYPTRGSRARAPHESRSEQQGPAADDREEDALPGGLEDAGHERAQEDGRAHRKHSRQFPPRDPCSGIQAPLGLLGRAPDTARL